jgi:hypothetical protein
VLGAPAQFVHGSVADDDGMQKQAASMRVVAPAKDRLDEFAGRALPPGRR